MKMLSDMQPFRIAGNLYFVGTYAASCHLIDTGDGLILIDTGYEKNTESIMDSMSILGFDIRDVKIILHSHGHGDHTDATAGLLRHCKAETWLRHEDLRYIKGFVPDHFYHDTEIIRLGNTGIRVIHTPGHTEGTVSFFFDVTENGQTLRCGMFGGAGTKQLTKSYLDKYRLSYFQRGQFFVSIRQLRDEHVDLFVGNHSWHNHYRENYAKMISGECAEGENPFVGADRWGHFLDKTEKDMLRIIREESVSTFVNFAHRGASEYCPENTFLSFYTGMYMGANGIETDVRRAADGTLVLFHDGTLERVTGQEGKIADYTVEQLAQFRVTKNGLEDRIVGFDDFLSRFAFRGITFAIELKDDGVGRETAQLIRKYGIVKNTTVTSFGFDRLVEVREYAPELKCGFLAKGEITDEVLERCRAAGIDEICPQAKYVTAAGVDEWHRRGFRVRAWGVSDEDVMRAVYDAGADGMTCNFPDKLAAYVASKAQSEN